MLEAMTRARKLTENTVYRVCPTYIYHILVYVGRIIWISLQTNNAYFPSNQITTEIKTTKWNWISRDLREDQSDSFRDFRKLQYHNQVRHSLLQNKKTFENQEGNHE